MHERISLHSRMTIEWIILSPQVLPSHPTFIHTVPFQPATDNRTNFSSDKAFHIFKKQRYRIVETRWSLSAVV